MGAINVDNMHIDGTHGIFPLPRACNGGLVQPRVQHINLLCAHPHQLATIENADAISPHLEFLFALVATWTCFIFVCLRLGCSVKMWKYPGVRACQHLIALGIHLGTLAVIWVISGPPLHPLDGSLDLTYIS